MEAKEPVQRMSDETDSGKAATGEQSSSTGTSKTLTEQ